MEKKIQLKKPDVKKFALLGKATIKLFAESVGQSLTEDVAKIFSEDVNYRIREVVSDASQYMRHSKRSKLTVNDVAQALKDASSPMVLSHSAKTHQWLPEVRLQVLNEEPIIIDNLIEKSESRADNQASDITITESWLNASSKGESLLNNRVSMQSLSQYFTQITEALSSDDEQLRKEAMADLVTNHSLPHILTQLLLFISKWMDRAIEHGDDTRKALEVLDALTNNRYVFVYKDKQWDIVSNILVESTCLKCQECQRDSQQYGAKILAKLVRSPYFPEAKLTSLFDRCLATLRSDNFGDSLSSTGAMWIIYTIRPSVILREDLCDVWLNVISTESTNIHRISILSILLDCISYILRRSRKTPLSAFQSTQICRLVTTCQSHLGHILPCRFLTTFPLSPGASGPNRAPVWRRRRRYPRRYAQVSGYHTTRASDGCAGPVWEGYVRPIWRHRAITINYGKTS